MRQINWVRVLTSNRIEYVERGPNVKRGEVNIRCPFCGNADPSHHMGLNLESGYWACWRNQDHRGKSPVRLLVKLLRISVAAARDLAGLGESYIDPDGFDEVAARVLGRVDVAVEEHAEKFLTYPVRGEMRPIEPRGATLHHWRYLVSRKFPEPHLPGLCLKYHLTAAVSGSMQGRIVIPHIVDGTAVSWSGRAITNATLRYKDLPLSESLIPPKENLYNLDCCFPGGEVLVVVEGQMDALKLDYYGRDFRVRSVALSTNSISDEQIYLLEEVSQNFKHVLFMMDNSSELGIVDSMRLKEKVSQIRGVGFISVPQGLKDAGELWPRQSVEFSKGLTCGTIT